MSGSNCKHWWFHYNSYSHNGFGIIQLIHYGMFSTVFSLLISASLHESWWYRRFCNPTFLTWNGQSQRTKSSKKESGDRSGSAMQSHHWSAISSCPIQSQMEAFVQTSILPTKTLALQGALTCDWEPTSSAAQCLMVGGLALWDHQLLLEHVSVGCSLVSPTRVVTTID